ncbi:MAG: hypothetical protein U9O97_01650 [Elusimicrobiota bacterium]|nr:hypothetical protein [Elusimicrobiota bacterium]
MKKRAWLLFVLIALLWWLNFYTKRKKPVVKFLPKTVTHRPSLAEIETKERLLKERLIKKAREVFYAETGREAKDTNELIERGLISPESL